jgi:hypothetical protein
VVKVNLIIMVNVKHVLQNVRFVLVPMTVLLVMVLLSGITSHTNVECSAWMVVINVIIQILVINVLMDGSLVLIRFVMKLMTLVMVILTGLQLLMNVCVIILILLMILLLVNKDVHVQILI